MFAAGLLPTAVFLLLFPLLLHAAGETAVSPLPHVTTEAANEAEKLTLKSLIGPFYTDIVTDNETRQRDLYQKGTPQVTLTLGTATYPITTMLKTTIQDAPVHLLLLADNSGSMEPVLTKSATAPSTLEQAAADVIDLLLKTGSQPHFSVWSFNKSIKHRLGFTALRNEVDAALASIEPTPDRPTCLYDTLTTAVAAVESFTSSRHRGGILLFTDGRDERSRGEGTAGCSKKARLEEAIAVAQDAFVPIHVVLLQGNARSAQDEMQQLTSETGGQLLKPDLSGQSAKINKILEPFNWQWNIQTDIYTLAGPQEGTLHIQLDEGEALHYPVHFTAPRDFPAPPTLTAPNDGGCADKHDKPFEFTLEDPHHQVAFATVQVQEINNPEFFTPLLTAGDANHLLPQDNKFTFTLHSNHPWSARANYLLQLTPYDNQFNPLTSLQKTCDLSVSPPTPPLQIIPESSNPTIEDENFSVNLTVQNDTNAWQTLDVYVRHERGWWWSPTAELYHYTCASPHIPATTQVATQPDFHCELALAAGSSKDAKAEKQGSEAVIAPDKKTVKLTVPHAARGDTFKVILQARDAEGHGLLAEPLPSLTGLNWLTQWREKLEGVWNAFKEATYLGYGLLCLAVLLFLLLLNVVWNAWRQKGAKVVLDQDADKQPKQFKLVVVRSADKKAEGKTITLHEAPVRVGRDETCALALPGDGHVSREHIEIQWINGQYKLIDNKSDNGTKIQIVKGQKPEPEQQVTPGSFVPLVAVASHDNNEIEYTHIFIGNTVLRFQKEFM